MIVTVHTADRRRGSLELKARGPVVENADRFEFALADGERGRITDHPSRSFRTPSGVNPLALAPDATYLLSVRASCSGAGAAASVRLLEYSAKARVGQAGAIVRRDAARLALRTHAALRGTSILLTVSGSGSMRVDGIRTYPIEAAPDEIEQWVDAAAHDDDVLDLVEVIRLRMRGKGEAARYHCRRIARRLRTRLSALRPSAGHAEALDAAAARLAMAEGNMTLACELWKRLLATAPRMRDEAQRELACCELKLGDAESGYGRLLEISPAFAGDRRFQRQLARARAVAERAGHARRVARLLEHRRRLVRPGALIELYTRSGLDRDQAERIARVWSDFQRAAAALLLEPPGGGRAQGDVPIENDLRSCRAVTTTGFGWSGSGAVNDWLREFDAVEMPLGKNESAVIGSAADMPGAAALLRTRTAPLPQLARVARSLVRSGDDTAEELRKLLPSLIPSRGRRELYAALENVFLRTILSTDQRGLLWDAWTDTRWFDGFDQACERFIGELDTLKPNDRELPGRLIAAIARLLLRTAAAKAEDPARLLLFNNLVRGVDFPLLRWIPGMRSIAVFRDPRDQFAAQCVETHERRSADEFVRYLKAVRRQYAAAMREASVAERVVEVQFERFVTSEDYRQGIADALNLSGCTRNVGRYFHPEASARNVGIHKVFPDQAAIETVARECKASLPSPAD